MNLEIIDVDCHIEENNLCFICPFCKYKGLARRQNKNKADVIHRHGIEEKNSLRQPHCIDFNLPRHIVRGEYVFKLNV
jgi:hypothetical protein